MNSYNYNTSYYVFLEKDCLCVAMISLSRPVSVGYTSYENYIDWLSSLP